MKHALKTITCILLCMLTLAACKKDSPQQQGEDDDDTPTLDETTSLNRQSGLPGEIFELTTDSRLTSEYYTLQIGTESVVAVRADNNTLMFTMPYMPSGDYYIDLKAISPTLGQLPIEVEDYTPIADVAQTYDEVLAWMEDSEAPSQDTELDQLMKQRFEEEINKLSDAEKKAQLFLIKSFLQQINSELAALQNSLRAPYINGTNSPVSGMKQATGRGMRSAVTPLNNDPNTIKYHAARFTAALVGGALIAGGGAAVVVASGPLLLVTGPAYAIIAIKSLGKMIGIMLDSVSEMYGIAKVAVSDALSFSSSTKRQQRAAAAVSPMNISVQNNANGAVFLNNVSQEVNLTFAFGSIASELESKVQGSFFEALFTAYHKFISVYTPLYNGQEKIQELLNTDKQILPPTSEFMPAEYVQEDLPVTAEEIKIENISPSGLNINMEQGQNGIVFTASSSTITDSIDISFDVVYTQEEFDNTVVKTIHASYDGRQEPANMTIVSGDNQQGTPGQKLPEKLQIRVTDKNGNTYAGAQLRWQVSPNGGSLSAVETHSNSAGLASAEWTPSDAPYAHASVLLLDKDGIRIDSIGFLVQFETIFGEWIAEELYQIDFPDLRDVNRIGFLNGWQGETGLMRCPFYLRERRIDRYEILFTEGGSMLIKEQGYRRDLLDEGSYSTCEDYETKFVQENYNVSMALSYTYNANTNAFSVSADEEGDTGTLILDGNKMTINLPNSFGKIVLRKN